MVILINLIMIINYLRDIIVMKFDSYEILFIVNIKKIMFMSFLLREMLKEILFMNNSIFNF